VVVPGCDAPEINAYLDKIDKHCSFSFEEKSMQSIKLPMPTARTKGPP
jgi:hypothetical protein